MTSVIKRFMGHLTILPVLVLVWGSARAQTDRVPKEGDRAPDFSIMTDRGTRISPRAFGGRLLVSFLRDHRIALETYRDPDRHISKSFGTFMFPETYIIEDGRIIRKVVGPIDWMSDEITTFVRTRSVRLQ